MHNFLTADDRQKAIDLGKALQKLIPFEFDHLLVPQQDELLLVFLMWWSNRVAYCFFVATYGPI